MDLDQVRLTASAQLDQPRRAALGQYLTPTATARFMAGLFPPGGRAPARLLDAGAGVGSLTAAFLDRWQAGGLACERVDVMAYEIDAQLRARLVETLAAYAGPRLGVRISGADFVEDAITGAQFQTIAPFTHAILNPPYKKIGSASHHRALLRQAGIETVNLYSAFVALAILLMEPAGQIVAIIPRSFCNGPYYRPFRDFLLARTAIRHIHLFGARDQAFRDDAVLQENVIIRLEQGGEPGPVTVSTSSDDTFADYAAVDLPFAEIVHPDDPERFIHVPTSAAGDPLDALAGVCCSLAEIGVEVSTGPVVDFRHQPDLRALPEPGAVPLLYPAHFAGGELTWPLATGRKPNAIMLTDETRGWLYPAGCYTVVRRFSSKEERRRIVASVLAPDALTADLVGFENHLNVFHHRKAGLPEALGQGLAAYLNSTAVDEHFRRYSGHTQVNATDLRRLRYPSRDTLLRLGRWALRHPHPDQAALDAQLEALR